MGLVEKCGRTGQTVQPEAALAPVPPLALGARSTLDGSIKEPVPLLDEHVDVEADLGLELDDTLLGEDVGDDLALAGVLIAVAGVEDAAADGDEGVVEFGLEDAVAVGVDDAEGVGLGDGDVVGGNADEWAYCGPRTAWVREETTESGVS